MKVAARVSSILFAFILISMPSFIQAQSVQQETQAFVADFVKKYNAADAQAIADLFTSDAIMIRSDNQTSQGKSAIKGYYHQFHSMMDAKAEISVGEVVSLPGNYSYTTGPYSVNATVKANGQKVKMGGTYAVLSQKIKGEWKVTRMLLMVPTPPQS